MDIARNRKARRDYQIIETFEAGIELKGTEVKSIRAGDVSMNEAFARVDNDEVYLVGCSILPYANASHAQHDPVRPRRLLLHRREIDKLLGQTAQKGYALAALRLYWKNGRVKVEIGLGRGKASSDKREDLKRKAMQREVDREVARFTRRGS